MKKVKINLEFDFDIEDDADEEEFLIMEGCDDIEEFKTCIKCACKKDPTEFIEEWEILNLSQVSVTVVDIDEPTCKEEEK